MPPAFAQQSRTLQKLLDKLISIERHVKEFQQLISEEDPLTVPQFRDNFVQSLDFLLITLGESVESMEPQNIEMLIAMTDQKSDTIRKLRDDYSGKQLNLNEEAKIFLFDFSNIYVHIVYDIHTFAEILEDWRKLSTNTKNSPSI
jgi:hypothetical protein